MSITPYTLNRFCFATLPAFKAEMLELHSKCKRNIDLWHALSESDQSYWVREFYKHDLPAFCIKGSKIEGNPLESYDNFKEMSTNQILWQIQIDLNIKWSVDKHLSWPRRSTQNAFQKTVRYVQSLNTVRIKRLSQKDRLFLIQVLSDSSVTLPLQVAYNVQAFAERTRLIRVWPINGDTLNLALKYNGIRWLHWELLNDPAEWDLLKKEDAQAFSKAFYLFDLEPLPLISQTYERY